MGSLLTTFGVTTVNTVKAIYFKEKDPLLGSQLVQVNPFIVAIKEQKLRCLLIEVVAIPKLITKLIHFMNELNYYFQNLGLIILEIKFDPEVCVR